MYRVYTYGAREMTQQEREILLNKIVFYETVNKKLNDALEFYARETTYKHGEYQNLPKYRPIDLDKWKLAISARKFYGEKT
jgi:hypothetical protein